VISKYNERELSAHPDPVALYNQAVEEYESGFTALAQRHLHEANMLWVEQWQQAVNANANDHKAREKLSHYLRTIGRVDEAEAQAEQLVVKLSQNPREQLFHRIYNVGLVCTQTSPKYRRRARFQNLVKFFEPILPLAGDVAECGCYKGLSAYVLCNYLRDHNPHFSGNGFHIFDSFKGLSPLTAKDSQNRGDAGAFACSEKKVRANLSDFPRIMFYAGWIPERFHEVKNRKFRFLNLDADLYEPTRDAISFFYPRLVPGGVIVCDDYNWDGAKVAIEECKAEFEFEFTVTEHNQAVIRKA